MISKKMQDALNGQLNVELYSSYLYLAMAAYYQAINLTGFAHWMRVQAKEELGHAMRIYDHMHERAGRVILRPLEAPPTEWGSPLAAFEAAYQHEVEVTGMINKLVNQAIQEKDHATNNFLQWFVSEQVEEEASTNEVVQKLRPMKDAPAALFIMDRQLAERSSE